MCEAMHLKQLKHATQDLNMQVGWRLCWSAVLHFLASATTTTTTTTRKPSKDWPTPPSTVPAPSISPLQLPRKRLPARLAVSDSTWSCCTNLPKEIRKQPTNTDHIKEQSKINSLLRPFSISQQVTGTKAELMLRVLGAFNLSSPTTAPAELLRALVLERSPTKSMWMHWGGLDSASWYAKVANARNGLVWADREAGTAVLEVGCSHPRLSFMPCVL